jgi:hypothetical protein
MNPVSNNNRGNWGGLRCIFFIGMTAFLCLILISCAKFGTKSLYRLEKGEIPIIKRIALYTPLNDDNLNVEPEIAEFMLKSAVDYCRDGEYQIVRSLESEFLGYEIAATDKIKAICAADNLDGIILSRISFSGHSYSMYGATYARIIDTEVTMKMFDSSGKLLVETLHNTNKGNSYAFAPGLDTTVKDGTVGALKRVFQELKKMKTAGSM